MKNYRAQKQLSKKYEKAVAQLKELGFEVKEKPTTRIGITRKSHEDSEFKDKSRKIALKAKCKRNRAAKNRARKSLRRGTK